MVLCSGEEIQQKITELKISKKKQTDLTKQIFAEIISDRENMTMMVIDSYCERILANETKGVVSVLPGGVTREEYVWRLDILIKDMFSELTDYTEADYRSGRALLLLLKKYCFSKKTLGNLQQEQDFAEYLTKTQQMLDEEITRQTPLADGMIPALDADKAFTIIANIMQLLTSVILVQKKDKEKTNAQVLGVNLPFIQVDKQEKVSLARENTAITDIVPYLDEAHGITDSFVKAKKAPVGSKASYVEWIEFKYLKMILELTKCKLDEIGVF